MMVSMSKDADAKRLAEYHRDTDPGLIRIVRYRSDNESAPDEPIKLLEVTSETPPAGIMPIFFSPDPDASIHYSSVIITLTPEEYDDLNEDRNDLSLPVGWLVPEVLYERSGSSQTN